MNSINSCSSVRDTDICVPVELLHVFYVSLFSLTKCIYISWVVLYFISTIRRPFSLKHHAWLLPLRLLNFPWRIFFCLIIILLHSGWLHHKASSFSFSLNMYYHPFAFFFMLISIISRHVFHFGFSNVFRE